MINDNGNQVAIGAENEIGKREREKLGKKRRRIEKCQFHPLQYACQLFN